MVSRSHFALLRYCSEEGSILISMSVESLAPFVYNFIISILRCVLQLVVSLVVLLYTSLESIWQFSCFKSVYFAPVSGDECCSMYSGGSTVSASGA